MSLEIILPLKYYPLAVIFDLDGLLVDTENMYMWSAKRAASEVGYNLSDSIYHNMIGKKSIDCQETLMEAFGDKFPFLDFLVKWDEWDERYIYEQGLSFKAGAYQLISYLNSENILCAIATSSSRKRANKYLNNIQHCFQVVATSDDINKCKPNPDIFLLAAERLKISPNDCLVLEDSLPGIIAASRAGMQCIMIPDILPPCDYSRPLVAAIYPSLWCIIDVFKSLKRSKSLSSLTFQLE